MSPSELVVAIEEIESDQGYPYRYFYSSLNEYTQIKEAFVSKDNYLKGETTISSKDVLNGNKCVEVSDTSLL